MQSLRHRIALAPVAIMAAALAIHPAVAETAPIKVPFSFKVGDKTFPAGDYLIRRDDRSDLVTLAAKSSSQSFSSILAPGAPSPWEFKIALKFDLVGQTHLLQSIQYGTMITGQLDKKALASERGSLEPSTGR
jgi:hypothetical protein